MKLQGLLTAFIFWLAACWPEMCDGEQNNFLRIKSILKYTVLECPPCCQFLSQILIANGSTGREFEKGCRPFLRQ